MAPQTQIGQQVSVPGGKFFSAGTLSPQQESSLQSLISQLTGSNATSAYTGPLSADQSLLERTSLQALEERALNLEQPSALDSALEQFLTRMLNPEYNTAAADNYFTTNIQNPALEDFQNSVLPAIGRTFGGADFFSSERAATDAQAQKDLVDSLTRSRADIQYQEFTNAQNRALQAAGLTLQKGSQDLANEQALYQAGQQETARQQGERDRQYQEFVRQQESAAQNRQQLLGAISIPTKENIVAGKNGSSGGGSAAAIGAIGSIAAAALIASDKNIKEDVRETKTPVLDALEKMPKIKSWKYKKNTGLDQNRHIGAMAQDFKKAFGVGDGKTISIIDAVGVIMKGLQEYAEERG